MKVDNCFDCDGLLRLARAGIRGAGAFGKFGFCYFFETFMDSSLRLRAESFSGSCCDVDEFGGLCVFLQLWSRLELGMGFHLVGGE